MDKGNGMGTWPVQLDWYADGDHSIIDTKPDAKCMVEQVASVYSENHEDYAKLFAAAPDLLEALVDSYAIIAGFIADYPDTELAAEARKAQAVNDAALAKAGK